MENNTNSKMITLRSNDGKEFIVSEKVAMQAQTIRHMIEDDCAQDAIPLPNVTARILAKVIEFCKQQADAADHELETETSEEGISITSESDEELTEWEEQFLDVDQVTLFELILAANYLDIDKLLDLACHKVAEMIKEKNPEEIRQVFNIQRDFTP